MICTRRHQWWGVVGLCLLSWVGCGTPEGDAPGPAASLQLDPGVSRALRGIQSAPVAGLPVAQGEFAFEVTERRHRIGQFPCARCHDQPLKAVGNPDASQRWAHANIQAAHPAPGSCETCHNYQDLQTLRLRGDEIVGFDAAYRLCAQCHFQQGQDWAGGAHGKRLAAWRGRRIIMNCTDCHDPHAPAFPVKIPASGPLVPRTGNTH